MAAGCTHVNMVQGNSLGESSSSHSSADMNEDPPWCQGMGTEEFCVAPGTSSSVGRCTHQSRSLPGPFARGTNAIGCNVPKRRLAKAERPGDQLLTAIATI